jgi:hypothetical protein
MASDSPQAAPHTRGEKVVTGGWLALGIAIPVSCIFSNEPFDFSAGLALLSLITLCVAFACWPRLFLTPINYKGLCDSVPRGSAISMALFVGLTVLRGVVELVA